MQEENRNDNEIEEEISEEPYSFVTEETRKRPGRLKKPVMIVAAFLVGGVVFGLVSGLLFRQLAGNDEESSRISFSSEAEPTETPTESPTPTPTLTPTPEPTDTPTPTPEPEDPEKRESEALTSYLLAKQHLVKVAEAAEAALVTVTQITSTEDWFDDMTEDSQSVPGLMLADNGKQMMILIASDLSSEEGRLVVTGKEGWSAEGSLLSTDPVTGLQIIAVSLKDLTGEAKASIAYAGLGSSQYVTPGQSVIAIGTVAGNTDAIAFGEAISVEGNLTGPDSSYSLIGTSIGGGIASEGFLLDTGGSVIGIVHSDFASGSGDTVSALGISDIRTLVEKLSNAQDIPALGIQGENVTAAVSTDTGLPIGLYVYSVEESSAAYEAGIRPGDVLTSFDGVEIADMSEYYQTLMTKDPGQTVTLEISRLGSDGYSPMSFELTVGSR